MSAALLNVFDSRIVFNILSVVPPDVPENPNIHGATEIYETKHCVTYGRGPEGGFVYVDSPRKPGWSKWHRDWFKKPAYTKVDKRQVAFLVNADGSGQIDILPDN